MKKNLLLLSLAGLAIASCTSDENLSENAGKSRLRFETPLMSTVTKAVTGEIGGLIYPTEEKFDIYGIQYSGDFNGWATSTDVKDFWTGGAVQTVETAAHIGSSTGVNAAWATTNDYFWVNEPYKLAFAAYSPSDAKGDVSTTTPIAYGATGFTFTDFKVKDVVASQYDLMYSDRQFDCTRNKYENTGIPLKFNHALSSIVFAAIEEVEKKTYEITSVQLIGSINNKGTFNQNITEQTGATPYTETSAPEWDELSIVPGPDGKVTYSPVIDGGRYTVTGANDEFTGGKSAILPIPQEVPDDAYVKLSYTVKTDLTGGGVKVDNYTKNIPLSGFIVTGTEGDKIEKWEIGYRYVYLINFGGSKKIFFVPTVNEWKTGGTAAYTIK
jgi:hypothetical protein